MKYKPCDDIDNNFSDNDPTFEPSEKDMNSSDSECTEDRDNIRVFMKENSAKCMKGRLPKPAQQQCQKKN